MAISQCYVPSVLVGMYCFASLAQQQKDNAMDVCGILRQARGETNVVTYKSLIPLAQRIMDRERAGAIQFDAAGQGKAKRDFLQLSDYRLRKERWTENTLEL